MTSNLSEARSQALLLVSDLAIIASLLSSRDETYVDLSGFFVFERLNLFALILLCVTYCTMQRLYFTFYLGRLLTASINEPRHEKTNVLASDLVRHKSGCTATEDG